MALHDSILDTIGGTPVVRLHRIAPPNVVMPEVFTVSACAPFTVELKLIAPPPLLATVASVPSATASL